jgi:DNA-binding CsgD family transcriptional regulator
LLLSAGVLSAVQPVEASALTEAIALATTPPLAPAPPTSSTVVLHGDSLAPPVVLDVFPLPAGAHQRSLEPYALVVARGLHASTVRRAALLRTLYALTAAEIEIAEALAGGQSLTEIAAARAVSIGTVRGQLKAIMAKLGVRRQVEVILRLSEL